MRKVLVVGLVVGAILGGLVTYEATERQVKEATVGWQLVPVVVAGEKLKAGAKITLDDLSQRKIPSQFVTSSILRPSQARTIAGRRTLIDLAAGDPIRTTALVHPLGAGVCTAACPGSAPEATSAAKAAGTPKRP